MNENQIDIPPPISSDGLAVAKKEHLTVLLYVSVWICWLLSTYFHSALPFGLSLIFGAIVICLYGSYQHEAVHNHPTKNKTINFWMAWPPLHLWIPFESYLKSHLEHHRCEILSDPYDDPESYYWYQADWSKKPTWLKQIYRFNNTFAGRILIGPALSISRYLASETKVIMQGDMDKIRYWTIHLIGCAIILYWVIGIAQMPLWKYFLCYIYAGTSLSLIRSYMEHKPATSWSARTLIVEGSWFSQLLFFNNNFHVLHHEKPEIPWYELKSLYFQQKKRILRENQHYFYKSYWEIMKKHLFTPKDEPLYPYPHIEADKRL